MNTTFNSFDSSSLSSSNAPQVSSEAKKRKPYTKKDTASTSSMKSNRNNNNNRGERMTFELDDVLRKYSPEQFKTCKAYDVGGVNILNKKPVDSKTALDKIKRRRETHNRVERRRRDCINQLIDELTSLLPKNDDDSQSKCHRVNVLRTAVEHIQNLTRQNDHLNKQLEALQTGATMPPPPPAIITTPAPTTNIKEETEDDSLSQYSYSSEASSSFYTSHALRSPISPLSPSHFSPTSSPSLSAQHSGQTFSSWESHSLTHLPPLNLSGTISTNPSTSRPITPSSLPSLSEISANLPSIPTIIEPSNPVSSPSMDMDGNNSTTGSHAKRLHRQTLPRLQLAPPSFHHLHPSSNQSGVPSSPSNYGQDSLTSPASAHSAYSSTSGSWSSSSSSFGPFSTASSPGPLSPYGGTSPRSPGYSPHGLPSTNLLSTSSSYPH